MARMVLMKIITIALAVYIICLSDFFLSPEGDIVNVLMVDCIDPSLSKEVTNPASLLRFMNVTSSINCSQNGTQRRMTEIKVSLNRSINERNQGKMVCQNATPYFIATGWFICEIHTNENHILNQKSFPQVSKIKISITDRSKITGINGRRIQLVPFPQRINANWSYSSPNGTKTTNCYMDIQFYNSTVENLTDQSSGPCIKNCGNAVNRDIVHDLCYKNTTNYFTMSNQDMNTNLAEPLPEDIHVVWNIHSSDRKKSTKCFTHVKLQRSATENQEQNCILEIIWLALFPSICIILLIIISCQWFKKDSSCHDSAADNNLSFSLTKETHSADSVHTGLREDAGESNYQENPIELSIIFEHENAPFNREDSSVPQRSKKPSERGIHLSNNEDENSRQQEVPKYLSEIQQNGDRVLLPDHWACSRETQHVEPARIQDDAQQECKNVHPM